MIYLGLELTSHSIRAILIEKQNSQYHIIEKKVFSLVEEKEDDLLKKLTEIKTYFSYEDIKYCIGIEASNCFIRTLDLPFHQKFKLNKILPFQLEEELPVDPSNLATDMLFLNKSTEADSKILVIATKKKELQTLVKNLNALGFDIEAVAPSQLSLNSLLPKNVEVKNEHQIKVFLNLDFNTTYLNIAQVYNNQYYITQSTQLNYQIHNLLEDLAKKYSITLETAKEEFLKTSFIVLNSNLNSVTKEQKEFSNNISSHLEALVIEINQEFFKLKLEGKSLSSMEVYGEALCIKNLLPFLKQKLKMPIAQFMTNELSTDQNLSANKNSNDSHFVNAFSLAVSLAKPNNQINFLQGDLSPTNQKIKKFWISNKSVIQVIMSTWVIALIFGLVKSDITYTMADNSYFNLKAVAKKTTKLKGRKLKLSSIKKIVKTYVKQKKSQDFFSELNKKQTPIYFLNKISNLPSKIKINITHLNISTLNNQLSLKGYSQDQSSSLQLKNYLQSISKNKKIVGRDNKKNNKVYFNYKVNL